MAPAESEARASRRDAMHSVVVPDDEDYAWLGWLMAHPDKWSGDDLEQAEQVVADQKRAIADSHPRDLRTRESMQGVVDGLEAAIDAYRTRRSGAE